MSNSGKPNASGLSAEESKKLPTRQPTQDEQASVKAMKDIYTANPNEEAYHQYDDKAIFHDPVGYCEGVGRIREQFNGLAKLFPKSVADKHNVLENPPTVAKHTILIDQDITYYRDPNGEPTKTMNSLLTIERNPDGKITKHTEEWNHQHEPSSQDGFFGMLSQYRKKATVAATGAFLDQKAPKEKSSD
ncbi:uncharacterized protein L969DRAFT_19355 [Mixia osmundae IAM 14324]|uniref:SnoaL-like domain-containing protein n=1 Tax=Mixia osmundae (strain CBS 9802 / IAM 14324 / JCM 22182 / KY 12970) TaxID=764103 RepID=G7DX61_MIXOS|nr:uncharacterized protein L969DRAFT_19355 [Mixia osmundae IAM 14324]KEI37307.1 hypothetical protein L969DRAFT_19355 [Mixia osmundae IAM 14324]GAA95171.1 hypothetical protein E5Q_01826 [Mixia osmundae IAM 14324]